MPTGSIFVAVLNRSKRFFFLKSSQGEIVGQSLQQNPFSDNL